MQRRKTLSTIIGLTLVVMSCDVIKDTQADIRKTPVKQVSKLKQIILYKTKIVKLTDKERDCLARNVFYEAGNQSEVGKLAVAQVTLNRLETGRWGAHVCDVVYSDSQFSWTKDRKKKWKKPEGELWEQSKVTVKQIQYGYRIKDLEGSLSYHAKYIPKPKWAKVQEPVKMIGEHIFYASVDTGRL